MTNDLIESRDLVRIESSSFQRNRKTKSCGDIHEIVSYDIKQKSNRRINKKKSYDGITKYFATDQN